jgi:hypothetical protein
VRVGRSAEQQASNFEKANFIPKLAVRRPRKIGGVLFKTLAEMRKKFEMQKAV